MLSEGLPAGFDERPLKLTPTPRLIHLQRGSIVQLITCLLVVVMGTISDPRFVILRMLGGEMSLPIIHNLAGTSRADSLRDIQQLGRNLGIGAPGMMAAEYDSTRVFVIPRWDLAEIQDSQGLDECVEAPWSAVSWADLAGRSVLLLSFPVESLTISLRPCYNGRSDIHSDYRQLQR